MTRNPGPGDRQPGETARAFAAFRIYLEAGPARSLAKVGQALGHRSAVQSEKWSSRWRWVERVQEYEAAAARTADDAHVEAIAERSRRQAQIAQLHGEATALVAREIVGRIQSGKLKLADLSDEAILRLAGQMPRAHRASVVTERLALGLTTGRQGAPESEGERARMEEELGRMSDDELDAELAGIDELAELRERKAAAG